MGRDNAGQRVLNARRKLRGADDCLENTFGRTLPDGAQCYVIDEQANYRLVHGCEFPEDEQHVVMPKGDKFGRWVRSEGLVGFALLEGGKLDEVGFFKDWKYQKLVQFEMTPGALVYIGTVPRLALFSAYAMNLSVSVSLLQGEVRQVAMGIHKASASGIAMVHPGERIVCMGGGPEEHKDDPANLQVVLA
jgi:hypothetical protein